MPVSKNRRKNGKKAKTWKAPRSVCLAPAVHKKKRSAYSNIESTVPNNMGAIVEQGNDTPVAYICRTVDDLEEYFVSRGCRRATPRDELNSLRAEFEALDKRKQKNEFPEDSYDLARWLVYKECLACLDSENPAMYEYDVAAIRKAGFILLNEKGAPNTDNMHDRLFWSFIPKSEERVIDFFWDGIGAWKG